MESNIYTVAHDDGTHQSYHVVSGFTWDDVNYFTPGLGPESVTELVRLYEVNIIGKLAAHHGPFVFFNIPKGMELPFSRETDEGWIYDENILFRLILEKAWKEGKITVEDGKISSTDREISETLWKLGMMKRIGVAMDSGEGINVVAVNEKLGFVSSKKAPVVVNSHFFLMDPTDMDSPYCTLGTPHGLVLQKGHVMNPPLNHRTMLLVDREDRCTLDHRELSELTYMIEGREYIPGENCTLHFRPDERVTPRHAGTDVVITEEAVVAVKDGGETVIPCAGFVLSLTTPNVRFDHTSVVYSGMEDYKFGAQVGPEMMVEGNMMDHLEFPFYVKGRDRVVYAPTVYPLPYETARAARICIGTDRDNGPVVIWAEGEGKLGIDREKDSTGASLLEMAEFCRSRGYRNMINLDGGGSAELIYRGKRLLKIADRLPVSNEECERPVPNGIYIG